ncbi:MAG: substrate-binding periplasmic protein [Telluria sp.]
MRFVLSLSTLALLTAASHAYGACAPLRIGYMDQHRPPYYLGTGPEEASPAGASVDLLREIAASAGCPVTMTRLPLPRLRAAAASGAIDAIPLEAGQADVAHYALPVDAAGNLDPSRALRLHTVMFVRASDTALRNVHPARDFNQRWIGVNHAAPLVALLREKGFRIDDGALDAERNLEKLVRNRIDGYAVSVAAVGDMDAWVESKFGNAVVRLEQPMVTHSIWLAVNKDYYARNRPHVDAMWTWVAENGRSRFAKIVKKYEKQPAASSRTTNLKEDR